MQSETTPLPDGIPSDLPPELNVLMGVYLLYWKIDELVDSINISPELTRNERHLLVNLDAPCRMGALASEMQILPSTLTALADGLEEKGLLVRERDPEDRRAWRLNLTEIGVKKRQDFLAHASEIFTEVSGLAKSETRMISALMLKVTRNIKANGLPEGAKACN
ncbi:MAG: MarR family transcriptional regulator [Rhodobacteraceae bacterium]|nr:MarR family transcriptional regulator [Paracoccaceae bacterium]